MSTIAINKQKKKKKITPFQRDCKRVWRAIEEPLSVISCFLIVVLFFFIMSVL